MKGHQHNKNVEKDVPGAHDVLLEGEQATCASGNAKDSHLNGLGMCANGPSRQRESADEEG